MRVADPTEANLRALEVEGEWKCRALKPIEQGEELSLFEGGEGWLIFVDFLVKLDCLGFAFVDFRAKLDSL
jgi:hypothetical protein